MFITTPSESRGGEAVENKVMDKDVINIVKFNALPSPVTARLIGGGEFYIESLCVQTALLRLDVCGQIDLGCFSDIDALIDINGNEHDPDSFWIE